MIISLITTQVRRHLEAINFEPPDEFTIEEIVDVVINSPHVMSYAEHDAKMYEALADDRCYDEGYVDGYNKAVADISALQTAKAE